MVTSDPLSRCVGGPPQLRKAGPESPLEWGGVARGGGWWWGGADVLCETPQGKCDATEGWV